MDALFSSYNQRSARYKPEFLQSCAKIDRIECLFGEILCKTLYLHSCLLRNCSRDFEKRRCYWESLLEVARTSLKPKSSFSIGGCWFRLHWTRGCGCSASFCGCWSCPTFALCLFLFSLQSSFFLVRSYLSFYPSLRLDIVLLLFSFCRGFLELLLFLEVLLDVLGFFGTLSTNFLHIHQ